MSKNITDNNLVADAKSVLKFWEEHSDIKLLETNCAQFKKAQNAFQEITTRKQTGREASCSPARHVHCGG
jgi:hypothetical protein